MFRLIPPRPTFHLDMTDAEKQIMGAHVEYWVDLVDSGRALLFGPVLDPNGVFGLGILEVQDDEEATQIAVKDPSVTSKVNTYELLPLLIGKMRL